MSPAGPQDMEAISKASAKALHKYIFDLPAERFQGKPLALAAEIEHYSNTQRLPMIFREDKMKIASAALRSAKPTPKVLIEFGTFVGCSALGWGAILKELNGDSSSADVHVYGFELDPELAQVARDLIKLSGVDDVVTVLDGPGSESLKKLVADGKIKPQGLDAVFIDHWENLYLPDLQLCEELKLLHEGSVVIADNTDMPGAPKYLAYVQAGGSGQQGAVRYETKSISTGATESRKPNIVEVTTVVQV